MFKISKFVIRHIQLRNLLGRDLVSDILEYGQDIHSV